MSWLDRVSDQAGMLGRAHDLMAAGRSAEACAVLERVIGSTKDPYSRAEALLQRLSALINLGRTASYTVALEQASLAANELGEPYLTGHLNALAALAAHHQGALDRCVTHLVKSSRALSAVDDVDQRTAWGWHDLAMAYSYLGFHGHALAAIERARQVGTEVSIPEEWFAAPGIRLRSAVTQDHNGDTDGCLRVLRDVVGGLAQFVRAGTVSRLRPSTLVAYGYAVARRAVLGEPSDLPGIAVTELLVNGGDSARSRDFRQLAAVCLAVTEGRPTEALARLDMARVAVETLGAAEPMRLRSLTLASMGDHAAAHQADRFAFRLAAQRSDRLRDVYVDGIAARIDQEEMRRTAARHEAEAMTDPLTGLPNRRGLERYVKQLINQSAPAVIGICGLDGFGTVNAAQGRHAGDLVLQRIAGVIHRVMRRGDFVARYGGDEFAVVLPGATMVEAAEVTRRIAAAVATEDWESLVPGTSVKVNVSFSSIKDFPPGTAGSATGRHVGRTR